MKVLKRFAALMTAVIISMSFQTGFALAEETADSQALAFPGAVGGGKYSKGARGNESISVYHVTNLNDSGKGSLRDAVSKSGRIVVFDLDGVIKLKSKLRVPSNTTILAQTAPGEGITLTGYHVETIDGAKDIIIRYLKIRPTDRSGDEPDGLGGRFGTRIIFDHCSVSWGVDELLTLYGGSYEAISKDKPHGSYYTVQNTIVSESLRMSSHIKGAHGYGAIFGADFAGYHHNLLAHHDSRSPRLDREMNGTEVVNNVIYDWGQTNSAYGGEPYSINNKSRNPTRVNYSHNYYNYGPSTKASIRNRIFEFSNGYPDEIKGDFYVSGNYVYNDGAVSEDNKKGLKNPDYANLLDTPVNIGEYNIKPQTAEEAYEEVLANAGATIPKRDAIDARIVNDVKNLTGRVINSEKEVGGGIDINAETTEKRVFEIPKEWIAEKGLSSYAENDVIAEGEYKGYTLIEAYVNEWSEMRENPTNPMITVISPVTAGITDNVNGYSPKRGMWDVISENETINYHAVAMPYGDTEIVKFELYDGNELIKDYGKTVEIDDNISLSAGTHYLTSRAYNSKGEKTQSTEAIVYVKKNGGEIKDFEFTEIGKGKFEGKGGVYAGEDGKYILYGSGTSGKLDYGDSCSYLYKKINGNFDIRVKVDSVPKFENLQVNGLMFRESLDSDSRMAVISDGWLKYGENERIITRTEKGKKSSERFFKDKNGDFVENTSGGENYPIAPYMRMVREDNKIYLYVSQDGVDWENDVRQPETIVFDNLPETVYVGYATDSSDSVSVIPYFSASEFSGLSVIGDDETTTMTSTETTTETTTITSTETTTETTTITSTEVTTEATTMTTSTEATTETTMSTEVTVETTTDKTINRPAEITGDADGDGILTANDAALVLKYVLNPDMTLHNSWKLDEARVDGADVLTINAASEILSKVLNMSYVFSGVKADF